MPSASVPSLTDEDGNEAHTSFQKADMLNSFFSKCFNPLSAPLDESGSGRPSHLDEFPDELFCDVDRVHELLLGLDTSKSNGPDGISARMLKQTAASIAPSITQVFNLSIRLGRVPLAWKLSHVVPIPKANNLHDPNIYRPISLLSIISKVLEKHLYGLIVCHLEEFFPLSDSQWGFRHGRSTVGALLSTTHDWFQLLESGKDICAIFLDYRKAFDSVPHVPLMHKLSETGLHVNIMAWLRDYLTLRRQQVVVAGALSDTASVTSGVPQGSVLGPLLFSIYINSVAEVPLSPQSRRVLYADDASLYRPISRTEDFLAIQSDIDALKAWSDDHLLQLNPSKCKYMVLTKKRFPSENSGTLSLQLGGTTLEKVESFKYLGVLLKSDLSWSDHITGVCSKAKRILGLLYRNFYFNSSPATIKQLYLSLVRPHLEYAAELWDPHTRRDIDKLESVQKFALKVISHQWDTGYEDLLDTVNIPTLRTRRLNLKLSYIFKVVHGITYFPPNIFQNDPPHSNRLYRVDILRCPFARANYYYHSFVPSSIRAWNSLDESYVRAGNPSIFKSHLRRGI